MHFSKLAAAVAAPAFAAAQGYQPFPLSNGFDGVKAPAGDDLTLLFKNAGGPIPNGPLPTKLSATAEQIFSVVAIQETFEVAFFTYFLKQLSDHAEGFVVSGDEGFTMQELYEDIFSIRAQEQEHALGANTILSNAGKTPQRHCRYKFPGVTDYQSAITLAQTFTDVVIGTLPSAQEFFDTDPTGDEAGLSILIGSIVGQESQQVGAFRLWGGKKPSAAPFLTGGDLTFAWSAAQAFVVPGSCPDAGKISVTALPAITVSGTPMPEDSTLSMSTADFVPTSGMSLYYFSGQNLPVQVALKNIKKTASGATFSASFPYISKSFSRGLTIAAIAPTKKYASIAEVAAAAKAGPGLIEVM